MSGYSINVMEFGQVYTIHDWQQALAYTWPESVLEQSGYSFDACRPWCVCLSASFQGMFVEDRRWNGTESSK
jgi:hypothetical protein